MRTGLGWDIDPDFPIWLWKAEVADGDTRKGYVEWVEQKKDEAREDEARDEQIGLMDNGSLGPAYCGNCGDHCAHDGRCF